MNFALMIEFFLALHEDGHYPIDHINDFRSFFMLVQANRETRFQNPAHDFNFSIVADSRFDDAIPTFHVRNGLLSNFIKIHCRTPLSY